MQRRVLLKSVTVAFVLLACGFLFVLFSSLGSKSSQSKTDGLLQLRIGETALRPVLGKRLWITRLDEEQRNRLNSDHPCKNKSLCGIPAATAMAGIELVFSKQKPTQLGAIDPWHGGFINPTNGVVYDLGGSVYKSDETTKESDLVPVLIN